MYPKSYSEKDWFFVDHTAEVTTRYNTQHLFCALFIPQTCVRRLSHVAIQFRQRRGLRCLVWRGDGRRGFALSCVRFFGVYALNSLKWNSQLLARTGKAWGKRVNGRGFPFLLSLSLSPFLSLSLSLSLCLSLSLSQCGIVLFLNHCCWTNFLWERMASLCGFC